MRTYEQIAADAAEEPVFSNSTGYEITPGRAGVTVS